MRAPQVAPVVYLQPKAAPRGPPATSGTGEERAEVHILCTDWLDTYAYKAIYNTPTEALAGTYTVHSYTSEADLWRFVGTFDRAP